MRIKIGLSILFLLAVGFVINSIMSSIQVHTAMVSDVEFEIEALQKDYESLSTKQEVTVSEIRETLHSATVLGTEVASLQNIYSDSNTDPTSSVFLETKTKLDSVFADDSKDARVPWYAPSEGLVKFVWQFKSVYSFSEAEIPVVWLCFDTALELQDDPPLLAYATGVYHADTHLFSGIRYYNTSVGNKYFSGTETDADVIDSDFVMSMIDDLNAVSVDGRIQTDSELADIRRGQDAIRESNQSEVID